MARGARRSRKRFGAALAPYVLGEATLQPGRGELWHLSQFEAIRDYPTLGTSVAKLTHAAYLTELCRELFPEHAADPNSFDLFSQALERLDAIEPSVSLLRSFELQLLDGIGLRPCLERCVRCGAVGPCVGFDPAQGMVCSHCGPGMLPLDEPTCQELRARQGLSFAESANRALSASMNVQARTALVAFVEWHLGRRLKTVEALVQRHRPEST